MLNSMFHASRSAMSLPFRPVDIEGQSRSYKLKEHGADDGARNQPRTDESLPASAEQAVLAAIEADRERCLGDLSSHLRADRDALARLQTAMDVAALRQGADEAKADFAALKVRYESGLRDLREVADSNMADYDLFRRRNRLLRLARQPENRTSSFVFLTFICCIEAIFNAFFFANGSDSGFLGGVALAAVFSAVNVFIGLVNGWFPLRWMNHRNVLLKVAGFALFLSLLAASILLSGFVAHFRDVSQASPDVQPLAAAYASLLNRPFGLLTIESWFLLALGVLCAGYAVAKGFGLDDPYPLYGAHDRRRTLARQNYEQVRQEVMDDASTVRDHYADEMRVKIETLRGADAQRQQILAARSRIIVEFTAHESHLAHAAQQLLSLYRRANEAARSTPPPAHFRQRFAFGDEAIERPAIRALREDQVMEIGADRLIDELDVLRRQVLSAYDALMQEKWIDKTL